MKNNSGLHGLSCVRSSSKFSCHANLNHLLKQISASIRNSSVLEAAHLYRTDIKRADGITLVHWKQGNLFLWDVTVVDSWAPRHLSAGSVGIPGTAAVKAGENGMPNIKDFLKKVICFNF